MITNNNHTIKRSSWNQKWTKKGNQFRRTNNGGSKLCATEPGEPFAPAQTPAVASASTSTPCFAMVPTPPQTPPQTPPPIVPPPQPTIINPTRQCCYMVDYQNTNRPYYPTVIKNTMTENTELHTKTPVMLLMYENPYQKVVLKDQQVQSTQPTYLPDNHEISDSSNSVKTSTSTSFSQTTPESPEISQVNQNDTGNRIIHLAPAKAMSQSTAFHNADDFDRLKEQPNYASANCKKTWSPTSGSRFQKRKAHHKFLKSKDGYVRRMGKCSSEDLTNINNYQNESVQGNNRRLDRSQSQTNHCCKCGGKFRKTGNYPKRKSNISTSKQLCPCCFQRKPTSFHRLSDSNMGKQPCQCCNNRSKPQPCDMIRSTRFLAKNVSCQTLDIHQTEWEVSEVPAAHSTYGAHETVLVPETIQPENVYSTQTSECDSVKNSIHFLTKMTDAPAKPEISNPLYKMSNFESKSRNDLSERDNLTSNTNESINHFSKCHVCGRLIKTDSCPSNEIMNATLVHDSSIPQKPCRCAACKRLFARASLAKFLHGKFSNPNNRMYSTKVRVN